MGKNKYSETAKILQHFPRMSILRNLRNRALLLGCGISRATIYRRMQQLRSAIFAHVAQDAIRKAERSVFDPIHALDLQYRLDRNTGGESS
jgi:hypothetical protein